jgi:hypothetical protein
VLAAGAVARHEKSVTFLGDLAAFVAALAVVLHWHIGKKLRRWVWMWLEFGCCAVHLQCNANGAPLRRCTGSTVPCWQPALQNMYWWINKRESKTYNKSHSVIVHMATCQL